MSGFHAIRALLEQANAKGSRSNVLQSLAWALALCFVATVSSAMYAPERAYWLTPLFATFTACVLFVYLGAFICFAFVDRDALRSESFSIQKMAIQHGVFGDDLTGITREEKSLPSANLRSIDSTAQVETAEDQ